MYYFFGLSLYVPEDACCKHGNESVTYLHQRMLYVADSIKMRALFGRYSLAFVTLYWIPHAICAGFDVPVVIKWVDWWMQ